MQGSINLGSCVVFPASLKSFSTKFQRLSSVIHLFLFLVELAVLNKEFLFLKLHNIFFKRSSKILKKT